MLPTTIVARKPKKMISRPDIKTLPFRRERHLALSHRRLRAEPRPVMRYHSASRAASLCPDYARPIDVQRNQHSSRPGNPAAAILLTRPTLAPRVSRPIVRLPQRGCSPLRSIFGQLSEVRRGCLDRWCAPLAQRIQRPTPEARRDDDRPACPLRQNGGGPSPRGADGGHRTTRGGHSPIQWRNTAPTVGMKLFNIAHFHRSRLRRLVEPTGAVGSIMISGAQIRAARG
jgi:hypothetical protein